MRIPGKLSIVVPDGYIAYTAKQTRRSFHPIVIVPQGTPIEKADKTPQRLEILTYFTKENAEKNRDNHFNDYINWKQISELRKENVIKINNSILYGIYYKRTDETGTVSRQTCRGGPARADLDRRGADPQALRRIRSGPIRSVRRIGGCMGGPGIMGVTGFVGSVAGTLQLAPLTTRQGPPVSSQPGQTGRLVGEGREGGHRTLQCAGCVGAVSQVPTSGPPSASSMAAMRASTRSSTALKGSRRATGGVRPSSKRRFTQSADRSRRRSRARPITAPRR